MSMLDDAELALDEESVEDLEPQDGQSDAVAGGALSGVPPDLARDESRE